MNKTKEIYLNETEASAGLALQMADDFIEPLALDDRKKFHLRLLVEETIGMVKAMAEDFRALFWMEEEGGEYRVRLTVKTDMDIDKKKELLSVSTSGKNEAAKGFMGKIREIIENGLLNFESVMSLEQQYNGGCVEYVYLGAGCTDELPTSHLMSGASVTWSLNNYREALQDAPDSEKPQKEAWDELEKSIVASIAKEVTVGIVRDRVDMTIIA